MDIYLDTANMGDIKNGEKNPLVKGYTTNPSIARKAGIANYREFIQAACHLTESPISFEVIADDFENMERQAREIASCGDNVYVKIPITNTKGESSMPLVRKLSDDGIRCNVTAVFTYEQIDAAIDAMKYSGRGIISVFAGRIADTGVCPDIMPRHAVKSAPPGIKVLWASPREVYNIKQAEWCGCHIITVPPDMLAKYEKLNYKALDEYSLETVKQFYTDALEAGYNL